MFRAPLRAGMHELALVSAGSEPGPVRDVLYFVAIVERRFAADYLELNQR